MPVQFEDQALGTNEAFSGFEKNDDLGKAYLDLHSRATSGDISLLSEEMRKDPSMTFKNVNDLAKGYIETKKLVGGIKHAPGKPEEYKFTELQNLHPGLKTDGMKKFLAAQFHGLDIDNERADKLQASIVTALDKSLKDNEAAQKAKGLEVETALRGEWKGDYDKNKDQVEKVLARVGDEEFVKAIAGNPARLKAAHKIVSLLSEDSIGRLGEAGAQNITEKTAAQKRINEMITNKEHLTKEGKFKTGAEYDKFTEEWTRLNALMVS